MSDEREQGRADAERSSPSVMRLFGQMMLLPFAVFVYGMGLFVRTIQGMQRAADQGMDVIAGGTAPSPTSIPAGDGQPPNQTAGGSAAPTPAHVPGGWSDLKVHTSTSNNDGPVGYAVEVNQKETAKMRDKDLNDDQLKLVRYKILFVKRDYEAAFPEQEEMVPDNMTGDGFAAWKVAEFIQQLGKKETYLPPDWIKGKKPKYPEGEEYTEHKDGKWVLLGLPERDKKYLRVYYEVLERYVREDDEDDEVDVLREIRDAIKAASIGPAAGGSGGGRGSSAGGGEADGGSSGGGRGY